MTHKEKAMLMLQRTQDNGWSYDWELIVHHIVEAAKEEIRKEQLTKEANQ
jgi:hypothetical protein